MAKISFQPNGCWIWTGAQIKGYGVLTRNRQQHRAHAWAWEQVYGARPLYPPGHRLAGRKLPFDHFKCDTPLCVNPTHVRPVTNRENVLRGSGPIPQNASKTRCPNGHEYDAQDVKGGRVCTTCRKAQSHASYLRRRYQ